MRGSFPQPLFQAFDRERSRIGPRTGSDEYCGGMFPSNDILPAGLDGILNRYQIQRCFSVRIENAAHSRGPMRHDPMHQDFLIFQRRNNIYRPNPVGAGGSGQIMDIQIGHRRGDDISVLIQNRVMDQRQVQIGQK